MIADYRGIFNKHFTQEKYEEFLAEIVGTFDYKPPFRIAETPVFIDLDFKSKLLQACKEILAYVASPEGNEATKEILKHPSLKMPPYDHPCRFIQLDFGICQDDDGSQSPQLIELQGFPSLYFYQDLLGQMYRKHYEIPDEYSIFPEGLSSEEYQERLRSEIVGNTNPEQVVLLEIEPEKQATRIDFLCAEKMIGIKELCITDLIKEGRSLFYVNGAGKRVKILKIYNRVIFDELSRRTDLVRQFRFSDDVDVEWIGHPTWFFRLSKYTLPFLNSKYVPKSFFLDKLEAYPSDLDQYVLKPLFSFAGSGVILNLTTEILDQIEDRENYIIQRKVVYQKVVQTLDENAKCEIRMMAILNSTTKRYDIVCNLARLTKGEMVGVKYNKDKTWVGGSIAFFE